MIPVSVREFVERMNSELSQSCNTLIDTSVRIATEFLFLQFDDRDSVIKFLSDVYSIYEKLVPKRNTICIVSPPSADKNYFFDAVASYYLNYGTFGTVNKNNNSAWADGAGRRIVLWNEPNYESYSTEKMK